jgi:hypothetical protein
MDRHCFLLRKVFIKPHIPYPHTSPETHCRKPDKMTGTLYNRTKVSNLLDENPPLPPLGQRVEQIPCLIFHRGS